MLECFGKCYMHFMIPNFTCRIAFAMRKQCWKSKSSVWNSLLVCIQWEEFIDWCVFNRRPIKWIITCNVWMNSSFFSLHLLHTRNKWLMLIFYAMIFIFYGRTLVTGVDSLGFSDNSTCTLYPEYHSVEIVEYYLFCIQNFISAYTKATICVYLTLL